jgi:hypothetical protein
MDRLLDNTSFDPAAVTALRNAYEGVELWAKVGDGMKG